MATFADSGPAEPASVYKATINWGRGRQSAGMVTGSNGRFVRVGPARFPAVQRHEAGDGHGDQRGRRPDGQRERAGVCRRAKDSSGPGACPGTECGEVASLSNRKGIHELAIFAGERGGVGGRARDTGRRGCAQSLLVVNGTADPSQGSLLQYDLSTGQPIGGGTLVPAGAGGLNDPTALAIGPGGNLFVANGFDSSILEYNSQGAFQGVFVSGGSGDSPTPRAWRSGPTATSMSPVTARQA